MASQPRACAEALPYRPHRLAKNERNRAMIADYLGGMSAAKLSDKYSLGLRRVKFLLWRHRVLLSEAERTRRIRLHQMPISPGRPRIWPDCPPHLADDYALFRRKGLRAAEARALLDPEFQA